MKFGLSYAVTPAAELNDSHLVEAVD